MEGSRWAEEEGQNDARGLFLARPTRDKTPLIGTWPGGWFNGFRRGRVEGGLERAPASGAWWWNGASVRRLVRGVVEEVVGGVVVVGARHRRILHTPLHLLVNRINQRHHGLSPHPIFPLPLSLFAIHLPHNLRSLSSLSLSLSSSPSLSISPSLSLRNSIAIYAWNRRVPFHPPPPFHPLSCRIRMR